VKNIKVTQPNGATRIKAIGIAPIKIVNSTTTNKFLIQAFLNGNASPHMHV
jgi:hypothetical protein